MRFTIDCSDCTRARTSSCQDCIVTFLTNREPDEAVVVDAAEFAALRRLSAAGLIPSLRNDATERIEWVTDAELEWSDGSAPASVEDQGSDGREGPPTGGRGRLRDAG